MKYPLLLLFILLNLSARSQVLISLLLGDKLNTGQIEFGLDGGANFSDIRGLDQGSMKAAFNIGFYFDIRTKNPSWFFHTGVLVKSSMGTSGLPVYSLGDPDLDNAFAGGEVRRKINYFNVPVGMKYRFKNNFYMLGGIMPSLRSNAYDIFEAKVNGDDLEYKVSIKDEIHRLDFGLLGGIGYRLMGGNGMNLTVRYYYGLVDVVIDDSTPDQFNNSIYLAVGIPIGAGKAKERREKEKATE
ncbi:porin family protein [Oscillatoria amoena NRMC-F 0135]|nr:porin family protein [Oscillatoria amoena NRMC-F 0135]